MLPPTAAPLRHGLASSLLALLLLATPATADTQFRSEVLGGMTFFSGLADAFDLHVDAKGQVHVLYRGWAADGTGSIYAVRRPGGWTRERIIGAAESVSFTEADMLVEADGTVHVAARTGNNWLEYYRRSAGVWSRSIVDADSGFAAYPQVQRNADGQLELLARRLTGTDIQRFEFNGSGWEAPNPVSFIYTEGGFERIAVAPSRIYWLSSASDDHRVQLDDLGTVITSFVHDTALEARGTADMELDGADNAHVAGIAYDSAQQIHFPFHFAGGQTTYFPGLVGDGLTFSARLALDGQGRVHAFYSDFDSDNDEAGLRYQRRNANGSWSSQQLAARWRARAADVDGFGNPHLLTSGRGNVFYDHAGLFLDHPVGGELLVAGEPVEVRWDGVGVVSIELSTDDGLSWSTLASGVSGDAADVVLPPVATAHARLRVVRAEPYTVSTSPAAFTIVRSSTGAWQDTPLLPAGPDVQADLEIAPDGSAHAAWIDPASLALHYGATDQGAWTVELVDGSSEPAGRPMLDLAPDGTPVVAYYSDAEGTLVVARRVGGFWGTELVEEATDAGTDYDVLVTADGNTHVAWYDALNQSLFHAQQPIGGGNWAVSNVGIGQAGWGRSFDLETDGVDLWIVFHDDSSGAGLNVARRPVAGGSWSTSFSPLGGLDARDPELAIDADGTRHILFRQPVGPVPAQLVYGQWGTSGWELETLPNGFDAAEHPLDLAVSGEGRVRALVNDDGTPVLAERVRPGLWTRIDLDGGLGVGAVPALAVGPDQQPRVLRPDFGTGVMLDQYRGLDLLSPQPGDVWPVGAVRSVQWNGPGAVDVELSVDGGASWQVVGSSLEGGSFDLQIPQLPTRFARVRLSRVAPASTVEMVGLFSIESSIALLNLSATPTPEGIELSWRSDPGPADLLGYRVERARDGGWTTLADGLALPRHIDPEGVSGDRYRVQATNGLGETVVLGETQVDPSFLLRVWPLPAGDGPVNVAFDAGRGRGPSEVVVYDVRGRKVRTLFADGGRVGIQSLQWDGSDASGREVAPGIYFVTLRRDGAHETRKILLAR